MKIWVDADACPVVVKEMLYRAAERTQIITTFVANQGLRLPPSAYLKMVQVDKGFDVADNHIVDQLTAGDLVISADIPLVAEVIEKEAYALNPRGEFYTKDNIAERLAMRNLMEELRSTGIETTTQAPFSNSDSKAFAAQLDRFLAKQNK